ncbi:HET-E1 [Symbiodinium natans]|uniref:HET-E1 protein n=1 Tax=Symbiodinium natans TaxID=878477 RepID=A0A812NPX9_9DINO|nr:HET-E1 [Symbiodinium natans]
MLPSTGVLRTALLAGHVVAKPVVGCTRTPASSSHSRGRPPSFGPIAAAVGAMALVAGSRKVSVRLGVAAMKASREAADGDEVYVKYEGRLAEDGTVFDSSEGALRHHVLDNFAVSILNLVSTVGGYTCKKHYMARKVIMTFA